MTPVKERNDNIIMTASRMYILYGPVWQLPLSVWRSIANGMYGQRPDMATNDMALTWPVPMTILTMTICMYCMTMTIDLLLILTWRCCWPIIVSSIFCVADGEKSWRWQPSNSQLLTNQCYMLFLYVCNNM